MDTQPTSPNVAPPRAPLPFPPQLPDEDDDDMTKDEDFFFYGNGRTGENPQDFIKKFESKDLKDAMSEDQKITAFK